MERFEELLESWINGNKNHVRQEFEKMSNNEKYSFANWLKDQYSKEWVDRTELFNMVIFITMA